MDLEKSILDFLKSDSLLFASQVNQKLLVSGNYEILELEAINSALDNLVNSGEIVSYDISCGFRTGVIKDYVLYGLPIRNN